MSGYDLKANTDLDPTTTKEAKKKKCPIITHRKDNVRLLLPLRKMALV